MRRSRPTTAALVHRRRPSRTATRSTRPGEPSPLVPVFQPRNQREAALESWGAQATRDAREARKREAILVECVTEIITLRQEMTRMFEELVELHGGRRADR